MVQRSAMRKLKRSRTKVGTMSLEGFWVAAMTIMPGRPSPRDQVAQRLGELGALVLGPAAHVEGELVDGDDVEAEVAPALDLAQARGQQDAVAAVHLGAQVLQDVDGAGHVGPDEVLGRARPRGELHLLAVEEGQGARRGRGRPRR